MADPSEQPVILFPAISAFFTSPCKGEVDRVAVGWGSVGASKWTPTRLTSFADLPLSGGGTRGVRGQ